MPYKHPTVSIIIPAFNSEEYIRETISSVLTQSFQAFEVIIINDGSTDNTEKICDEFLQKDNRIHLITKTNGGVSSARNVGLTKASGKYICFVDSDDILDKKYLEEMITLISKNKDIDLALCEFKKFKNITSITKPSMHNNNEKIISDNEKYSFLYNKKFAGYPHSKIFKKSIIENNNLQFDAKISMLEDEKFIFDYLESARSVILTENQLYYYRQLKNSLCHKPNNDSWFTVIEALDYIISKANTQNIGAPQIANLSYQYLYFLYEGKYRLRKSSKQQKAAYAKIVKQKTNQLQSAKKFFSAAQKFKLFLYRNFNSGTFFIRESIKNALQK